MHMKMYNKTNHDYKYLIFINFLSGRYLSKLHSKLYKTKSILMNLHWIIYIYIRNKIKVEIIIMILIYLNQQINE